MITALALIGISFSAPTQPVDVAVVGGGLAGLQNVKYFVAAGKTILVLEVHDRVGGRVLPRQINKWRHY